MADAQITKAADKLICLIYKSYLERIRSGMTKQRAKDYSDFLKWKKEIGLTEKDQDAWEVVTELCRAFHMRRYPRGAFQLSDEAIYYMENRFHHSIGEFVNYIAAAFNIMVDIKSLIS